MNRTPTAQQPGASEAQAAAPKAAFALPDDLVANLQTSQRLLAFEAAAVEARDVKALLQHEQAEHEERVRGDEPVAARAYLAAFNARPAFRPPLDALIRLYARRRSAANISKLYDATPELMEDQGFLQILQSMLNDGNVFVVSNALATLTYISQSKGENLVVLDQPMV